jgi:hypothetical protein
MDIPQALKNAHNVLCFDTERSFLRAVTNPIFDFIKSTSSSKDCSFSFRIQNGEEQEYAQVQYGSNSAALSYGFSCRRDLPHNLFDAISYETGSAGKCHLLANAPAGSDQYALLRSNAFHTYSVQKLWRLDHIPQLSSTGNLDYAKESTRVLSPPSIPILFLHGKFTAKLEFFRRVPSCFTNSRRAGSGVARIRYFADRAVVTPMLKQSTPSTRTADRITA